MMMRGRRRMRMMIIVIRIWFITGGRLLLWQWVLWCINSALVANKDRKVTDEQL